jgi:hypothetical protein
MVLTMWLTSKQAAYIVVACTFASAYCAASAPVDLDLVDWVIKHGGMVSSSRLLER